MPRQINRIVNIIIMVFVGGIIKYAVDSYWNYKQNPAVYEVQSAPWYTGLLLYGAVTLGVLVICAVVKIIIRKKLQQ